MNHPSRRARTVACAPLALSAAIAVLHTHPVHAQQDQALAPVVVTTTRFAADAADMSIGASVIYADEIRAAGINNANEAIRKLGGIYGRASLTGNQDYSLDARGFGDTSNQNTIILVDGIRLSESELAPALLSSVPVESIERIEIVRGGSSVLYGEGATGGVIHITTRRDAGTGQRGSIVTEIGTLGHRELRASAAKRWDGVTLDANIGALSSDNDRRNAGVEQQNFSGGLQWAGSEGRLALRVDASRQDARLPGSLTLDQFNADPHQASTPRDHGSFDTDRYSLLAERRIGALDLAAELAHRERKTSADYGGFVQKSTSRVTQFSPRLRHRQDFGGARNELVIGLDFTDWERNAQSGMPAFGPLAAARGTQESKAVYIRDEVRVGAARIAAGARHEKFDKKYRDPFGFATTSYDKSHSLNAWELQGRYDLLKELSVFARAGRSYRVANIDENAATPVIDTPLDPQTSRDLELGVTAGSAARSITVRAFRHRLNNEIFYDWLQFANVNLDPTQRQGLEIEGKLRLSSALSLNATLQRISAKFRGGPYQGNTVPLVPETHANLRVQWQPSADQTASVGVQWADQQRYGGDSANSCSGRIPSFATVDARYAKRYGDWEFAVVGTNLTDRDYFTSAYGACRNGIYPEPGRQVRLTARLDF